MFEGLRRGRVEEVAHCHPHQLHATDEDHGAGDQRRPVIGRLPARPADEPDRDADEGGDARQGVGAVMPGVGLERGAPRLRADPSGPPCQNLLDDDDDDEDQERRPMGEVVRCADLTDALHGNQHCREDDRHRGHDPRQRLRLAIAIRMPLVGRGDGHPQPPPDDQRRDDVAGRLHPVGDQGIGIAEHPGEDFERRQGSVHRHADQRHGGERRRCRFFIGGHRTAQGEPPRIPTAVDKRIQPRFPRRADRGTGQPSAGSSRLDTSALTLRPGR